jgi:hydrogenase maturation protein HypF
VVAGEPLLLRRARGYVPLPVRIGRPLPPLLALGSQLKNTLALSVGDGVVLSGHHGDLESAFAVDAVRDSVVDLIRLYGRRPEAVACDDNLDYASSQVAEQLSRVEAVPLVRVQHHHAHVLACMAEHRLEGPVLGVCWDGAGAGEDGTVWGGEFLMVAGSDYRRVAHLRQFRLPGGDHAAREPRRAALGLLLEMLGPAALETELAPVRAFTRGQLQVLLKLVKSGIQSPPTSSAGRLFDAVASLLNLRQVSGFEGQAAMALEHAALEWRTDEVYPFTLRWQDEKPGVVDWEPLVRALLEEHLAGEVAPRIVAKVHNTLVEAIVAVARRVREPRVVMTGGCFQNQYLTERAVGRLREEGFQPYWQRQAPPNDGGLSLGQVMAAVHRMDVS